MKDLEQFDIEQEWASYTPEQHSIWRKLFHRQEAILARRACQPFLDGLKALGVEAEGIPDFRRLNEALERATRWRIVAVPGLVPDDVFFEHLANRRFPSTCFIRRADQLDYLQEPDIFHDIFGHVPMLVNPIFADYMEAYGKGGLKALRLHNLEHLARLYWYTVEFGLALEAGEPKIYGAGILSSFGESHYSLESKKPHRLAFDLRRMLRTRYRTDTFQQTYFVIDRFEDALHLLRENDFEALCAELDALPDIEPSIAAEEERLAA